MAQIVTIRAESLSVKKDNVHILDELDFDVATGSITGLIGPGGSGKTTLMRAIVGLQKISGTLEVLGSNAGNKKIRSKIGYVTQAPAIYDDLTVLQNVRYFAALVGASHSQVEDTINLVDLGGQRSQMAKKLSGGQKARVSLAIALLGEPELLVLDEPTVGLDPLLRRQLWQLFMDLAAQGKTLIISSHVMDEAEKCQSVLLLRDGKLLWHDSRDSLLKTTRTHSVEEAFLKMVTKNEGNV